MWSFLVCCLASLAGDEVVVKPLQGEAVTGSLVQLSREKVTIRVASANGEGVERSWPTSALHYLRPRGESGVGPESGSRLPAVPANTAPKVAPSPPSSTPPTPAAPGVAIELVDGSRIPGQQCQFQGGSVTVTRARLDSVVVDGRKVRSVRFRPPTESLQAQWEQISSQAAAGDQVVVRKSAPPVNGVESGEFVLDQLEGVVREFSATAVQFEYEGDRLDVPRERLEGVLFRQRATSTLPNPLCRLRDGEEGSWEVLSYEYREGRLKGSTSGGAEFDLPWSAVRELDYSAGNLTFLSDLPLEEEKWRPYVATAPSSQLVAKWFALRRDTDSGAMVPRLEGQTFDKWLKVHSQNVFSFRLTRNYQRFQAVIGIQDEYRSTGNVRLVIWGDGRELAARELRGTDPPWEVDLPVDGVRRLKFLVDFGADSSDAGDHLVLGNARLTK